MRQLHEKVYEQDYRYRGHGITVTGRDAQWEINWRSRLSYFLGYSTRRTYASADQAFAAAKQTIDELLSQHSIPRSITIKGFKSIRSLDQFELKNLNVLLGANGAGKTNFVDFFRLLHAAVDGGLAKFVFESGKADTLLFDGPRTTEAISAHIVCGSAFNNEYALELRPNVNGELYVAEEKVKSQHWTVITQGPKSESGLKERIGADDEAAHCAEWLYAGISLFAVYHFHSTDMKASLRRYSDLRDYRELRPDGGNIAAFLRHLSLHDSERYEEIRYYIRLVAPYFDDFILDAQDGGPAEQIRLEWRQRGSSTPMQPYQLSDGTIRFICLATALLQPSRPLLAVIDEPELGLHPFALGVVASLLRQASETNRMIVSTQSAALLDSFDPEDVVVVDRVEGASRFRRLQKDQLNQWLDDYTLGQLWRKNVIDGGPVHE